MEISRAVACTLVVVSMGCVEASSPGSQPPPSPPIAAASTDEGSAARSDPRRDGPTPARNEPQIADAKPREPNPYVAPLVRVAGGLTVHAPPKERRSGGFVGRLRSHVDGGLSTHSAREWVGPQVPGFVELLEGTTELFLLDREGDEFLAFYRDPYGASSCTLSESGNCRFFARLYDVEGNVRWELDLTALFSAPSYLEIQDIRYADGVLYFNEACQSFSKTVKGRCSSLVAVDPAAGEVRWRTRPLVSNGRFLVHGDYIVSGYGFTDERDFVYVVSRDTGAIVQEVPLRKAAEGFAIADDGRLEVTVYPGTIERFEMRAWETAEPRLVMATRDGKERITTGRR